MAQPSVVDELADDGPKVIARLDPKDSKEAESLQRFRTARAKRYKRAMPSNLLQAEQKLAGADDHEVNDPKQAGPSKTTLTYHSRNTGR